MNWNQILTLLMVVEKSLGHPTLKFITDGAMKELQDLALKPTEKHTSEHPTIERKV